MDYTFTYESEVLPYGIELNVTLRVKIKEGPIYDSPRGPLGHTASIIDSEVMSITTIHSQDIIAIYGTSDAFKKEVDQAVLNEEDKIIAEYWRQSECKNS